MDEEFLINEVAAGIDVPTSTAAATDDGDNKPRKP